MPAQMRRIYDTLELGGFENALPIVQKYADAHGDYIRNHYDLLPETRQRILRRWAHWINKYGYA